MTKAQHTPGPWKMVGQYRSQHWDDVRLRIDNREGVYIAITSPYNGNDPSLVMSANLIAAAPELLAALELAYKIIEENYNPLTRTEHPTLKTLRAAIAKAKGE